MPLTLGRGDGTLLEECEQVVDKSRIPLPLLQTHLRPTLPILSTDTCIAWGYKWGLDEKRTLKENPQGSGIVANWTPLE